MFRFAILAAFLGQTQPSPQQLETAREVALQNARTEIVKKEAENTNNIILTLIAALSASGGIGTLIVKIQDSKYKQQLALKDRDSADKAREAAATESLVESLRKEVDRLSNRVEHYEMELGELRSEYNRTRDRLGNLELHGAESPNPVWEADDEKRITAVNAAFESQFLAPIRMKKGDVVGKTFREIFGAPLADQLDTLDAAALKSPQKQQFTLNVQFHQDLPAFAVGKTIRLFNGRAIGVYGSAMAMTNYLQPKG